MIEQTALQQRMDEAYAAMERNLRTSLYAGDEAVPPPKKTIREKLSDWKYRIHCAWLVLRGRADIC